MPLSQLPWEVLDAIARHCGQADVLSLAVACPAIADAVLPDIYRCIVLDATPQPLPTERPVRYVAGGAVPCTVVRTIAGIKQCLEALAARPRFAAEVRSFVCRGNVALSDNVFLPLVAGALSNLVHLRELAWSACPELPPSMLAHLATHEGQIGLEALAVDLAIRPGESYPQLVLPALRSLRVRPFLDEAVLAWVSALAHASHDLDDIELGRFLDSKAEVGSSYRFVGLSDVHSRFDSVAAVQGFFGRVAAGDVRRRWQLRRLALSQTDTSSEDVHALARAADLRTLSELVLTGSGNEDEVGHRLLAHIVSAQPRLERLTLNWRASQAGIANLFVQCCAQLETLSLHIRDQPRRTLELLAETCASTLRKLTVSVDSSFTVEDFEPLRRLPRLEALKMPFTHSVATWELAAGLPQLRALELCLCSPSAATPRAVSSARAPNVGLLTSGILDAWNDSLPSPLQYANIHMVMRQHEQLCYVTIDGHTTCLRDEAPPLSSFVSP